MEFALFLQVLQVGKAGASRPLIIKAELALETAPVNRAALPRLRLRLPVGYLRTNTESKLLREIPLSVTWYANSLVSRAWGAWYLLGRFNFQDSLGGCRTLEFRALS